MPKTKSTEKTIDIKPKVPAEEADKIIEIDEEAAVLDDELIPGETEDEELEDDEAVLDEEEVDPFKDKWEE